MQVDETYINNRKKKLKKEKSNNINHFAKSSKDSNPSYSKCKAKQNNLKTAILTIVNVKQSKII